MTLRTGAGFQRAGSGPSARSLDRMSSAKPAPPARTVKKTADAVEAGAPSDTKSAVEQDGRCTRASALHGDRRRAADARLDREEQVNEPCSETCHLDSRNRGAAQV